MSFSIFQPIKPASGRSAKRCVHRGRHGQWIWTQFLEAACVLGLAMNAQSATYYVDFSSGSDANDGMSKATPWKDAPGMTGFSATYTHSAGDRFIFKGGVMWPTNIAPWNIANGGTVGNNDYYGVDMTWFTGGSWVRPVFDGGSQYPLPLSVMYGYWVVTGNYITLDNLTLQNIGVAGTNQGNYAISLQNCHDILVENMNLAVMSRVAILLSVGTGNTVGNYEFASNDISACSWGIGGGPGNSTVLTNLWIHDNHFHDFRPQMDTWVHGDGIYLFVGDYTDTNSHCLNCRIYNNRFDGDFSSDDGTAAMSGFIWPQVQSQGDTYIYNNTMTYTQTNADGVSYAIGGGGFTLLGSLYIFNNSVYGDVNAAKFISSGFLGNLLILNNVYYGGYGCYSINVVTNLVSDFNDYNGAFLTASSFAYVTTYGGAKISGPVTSATPSTPGTGYTVGSTITPQYGIGGVLQVTGTNSSGGVTSLSIVNGGLGYTSWPYGSTLLTGTGHNDLTLSYAVTPSGIEAHGITNNPAFVSVTDLHLQTNSPAIGVGTNLTAFATTHNLTTLLTDIAGNPRPATGAWDIGAYQMAVLSPAPSVSLTASPTNIISGLTKGQFSTLTWSSVNATSVTLSGFGQVPLSGSTNVSPATTTTYTATATNPNGSNSASASVAAAPAPPGPAIRQ